MLVRELDILRKVLVIRSGHVVPRPDRPDKACFRKRYMNIFLSCLSEAEGLGSK